MKKIIMGIGSSAGENFAAARNCLIIALGVLLALALPVSAGSSRVGTASGLFLNINPDARSAAMGNAGTGMAQAGTALYNNPAILSEMKDGQLSFSHFEWFQDINYDYLGFVLPLAPFDKPGVIGGSLTFVDLGEVQRTTVTNQTGVGLDKFGNSDFSLNFGYGRELIPRLSVGGSVKYVSENLENVEAQTVAMDAGIFYRPEGMDRLTLGAVVRNLGPGLSYSHTSEKLPLACELGLGYRIAPLYSVESELNFALDLGIPVDDGLYVNAGTELWLNKMFALRLGYDSVNDAAHGFSFGAGFRLKQFDVDYAFTPYDRLGNVHRISLTYSFSPEDLRQLNVSLPSFPAAAAEEVPASPETEGAGEQAAATSPTTEAAPVDWGRFFRWARTAADTSGQSATVVAPEAAVRTAAAEEEPTGRGYLFGSGSDAAAVTAAAASVEAATPTAEAAEAEHTSEEIRAAEEATRAAEAARAAEAQRVAEAVRAAEVARAAEAAETARVAEEMRVAEEARMAEAERTAEAARVAEAVRMVEAARAAEAARVNEAVREAEAARVAEAAEAARVAEAARAAELAEAARIADAAEAARVAEAARAAELAEAARIAEAAEAARVAEAARAAELAEAARIADAAEAARAAEAALVVDHFNVTVLDDIRAGEPFRLRIIPADISGNVVYNYAGPREIIKLQTNGTGRIIPSTIDPGMFTAGSAELYAIYTRAEAIEITAQTAGPQAGTAAAIEEMLVLGAGSNDRSVIRLIGSGELAYSEARLVQPQLLVVDIPGARLVGDQRKKTFMAGPIVSAILNQESGEPMPLCRLTVALNAASTWQISREKNIITVLIERPAGAQPTRNTGEGIISRPTEALPAPASPAPAAPVAAAPPAPPVPAAPVAPAPAAVVTGEVLPGDFAAYYQAGLLHLNKGEYREALASLQEAARLRPDSFDVHYALSNAYDGLGDYVNAVRELDLAREQAYR